ncbi:structural maintenance of chromosomes protein 5 [Impatiens glandulifera]|uniref:structural maintenance of chromosomes protein 5 n=1 Tax=Impatiens glandulifera TaxID=253017 RepID=UPI001FB08997|nr:structural maintenance of chromosomes protein 5 [Impatiens glandulifera]
MEEPRRKRSKTSRGEDDYLPGSIIEIELHNFMTFSSLTCKPASRLNLVVGPNGSGKSSLVCAIALGLGGEPQLLGRASSIGAFVKRGEESCYVKISLKGESEGEILTITRKMDTRNKSEWLFNGKLVTKKDVLEVIKRFNIQVNNLTQFLPQDRVCEFAKLTPIQLLEETEKAVGDPQLPVQHRALIDKSSDLKKLERAIQRNKEYLDQLKALNAEQERDVKRVRQREELLEKVESMKKKLPWLEYDMEKTKYLEAKREENDAKKKLEEAVKTWDKLKEPIDKQKKEKATLAAKCKQLDGLLGEFAKKRTQLLQKDNSLGVQVSGKYNEIEELKRQEESRQERILKAKEDLAAAETVLANLPPFKHPKEELARLSAQIVELGQSTREKRLQKSEQERSLNQTNGALRQHKDRLRDMEDTNIKLLQALQNSGAERIREAYNWVQEHRQEFNKEVFGPVLLEVKVSNKKHADYLEGHVPHYIWKAFITQDSGDRDILFRNIGSMGVPIINHVEDESSDVNPYNLTDKMHALGIHSRLDQVFDAPHAVKEVLVGQFGLDHSYIGSKEADQRANEVKNLGIMDLWTPENHYRWSRSRYGGHISASVESVDRSRLILCQQDTGELEKLTSRIKELTELVKTLDSSLRSLQSEITLAEDEEAKLARKREDITSHASIEMRKRKEIENRVNQRKINLKSLEREEDLHSAIAKLDELAASFLVERLKCVIEIKDLLVKAVSHRRTYTENNMASLQLEAKIREMEINGRQQEKLAEQAALHLDNCKKKVEDCRNQLSIAKRRAESVAIITPELDQAFREMPGTIEELEAAIQDLASQANSILSLNHNILQEYESRQKQIRELSTKQELDDKGLKKCLDEINSIKGKWLPTLRNLISQINVTFGRNFQEMAIAGEVSLDEHEVDFDKYGIHIKVKFRKTGQLQVLSAHHQSGGERSVSTILYLVSLQDLTNCPFRVVDEINQGMDPINERKMFQQLVRVASQPNTPQCFLLTPKLLPDLMYSESCSILNIFNGPWIEPTAKVWSGGESWSSATGLFSGASICQN